MMANTERMTIEVAPHGLIVRGPIPIDAMDGIQAISRAHGFDLLDAGACRPLGASMVITNKASAPELRQEIEASARRAADGDALEEWLQGPDTGTSSLTIAAILSGRPGLARQRWIPSDPSDLGRCLRLLDVVPAWKSRLHEVAEEEPKWGPLVDAWEELAELYQEELPNGTAPKLYARMKELAS